MPRRPIPERAPIGDHFEGLLISSHNKHALARTVQPETEVMASGALIVRYGLQYLGKPHQAIVPGLVALDYGDILTGEAAWEFLLNRSNLHPRADVVGYRSDGQDDMTVVKLLDLAAPIQALVYADEGAVLPVARINGVIASADEPLPARLLAYVPRYETAAAWQEAANA